MPTKIARLIRVFRNRRVQADIFEDLHVRCPKCGGRLILRQGRRGPEFFCLCPGARRPGAAE